ncbi:dihydroorotate oxidase B, catalytic subunit [Nannocystis exedens]|uniref:Dihydroorotate dehydrogenase n=1 Tax=Nannocystis exedens TaxID=54 RepID=A0A1I1TJZ5_9BACT|nr:dihydroorotate dehydrogenase [Nannocystis exedens]PCC66670.1 dihydroorotate dehydrogenase [Nannocystis exedens]SFD55810.1 dihydroorotate oxidase B, catalytic subunit [Nannocystis exedens]
MTEGIDLTTSCGPIALRTPVLAASGCFAYGQQFAAFTDLRALGGISTKGISPLPRFGNPLPRICETTGGMLNSIGLENVGVEAFLRDKLPFLRDLGVSVWVNFFGVDFETYVDCARQLSEGQGIDALEMNISCPNIKKGGIEFGTVPEVAHRLTRACVEVSRVPIIVKLSPNVSDIVAMADAVQKAGAAGVSLINTITGMAIDVRTRRPKIATTYGGLSGPAIKPIALRMVHQVARALPELPICGMGGILSGEDALEFLMAGAHCVQVGTANFAEPGAGVRITEELRTLLRTLGFASARAAIGSLQPHAAEPEYLAESPWSSS